MTVVYVVISVHNFLVKNFQGNIFVSFCFNMYYVFKLNKIFMSFFFLIQFGCHFMLAFLFLLFLVLVQFFYQIIWSFSSFSLKLYKPGATYVLYNKNQLGYESGDQVFFL
jgi:hypothetical protein